MNPLVSVLIPTRNRTGSMLEAVASFWDMAENPEQVEVIVRVHEDDPATVAWARERKARVRVVIGDTGDSYGSMSEFVNCMAAVSHGDWLWPSSDDWRVRTKGWDRLLREVTPKPRETCLLLYSSLPGRRLSVVSRGFYRAIGHLGMTEHGDSYMSSLAHSGHILGKVAIDLEDRGLGEVGPRDRVKTWAEYRSEEVARCFEMDKRKLGAVLGRKIPDRWTTRDAPEVP